MKSIIKYVVSALALSAILLPLTAQAQAPGNMGVHARLKRQNNRIKSGVATGALTHHQAMRLHERDAQIYTRTKMDRRRHGGMLTAAEHARVEHHLNKTSRKISQKKHM